MGFRQKAVIMDKETVERAITRISFEIIEKNRGASDLCLVGVKRRGVVIAQQIAKQMAQIDGKKKEIGVLDISHYRDDKENRSEAPSLGESEIGFDVNDKCVILIDDVLYTGRTIRAAIDAIMDVGRPKKIQLVVLVDRGHRELPIRPDYVGKNVPTSRSEEVKVLVPEYDGEDFKVLIGDMV